MQPQSDKNTSRETLGDAAVGNFFMPSEAAPHAACWMAWPTRRDLWGEKLGVVRQEFAEIARAIAAFEPVIMVVDPADASDAGRICGPDIRLHQAQIDDSWMRDSGPTFLVDGKGRTAVVNWRFNAWGNKYHPHDKDAGLKEVLAWDLDMPVIETPVFLEGGGIFSDGEGTIFTTESCLLNPNRNPGLSKSEIEIELKRCLNASKIIWLPGDPTEVETDGHIDGLACLARPGLLLVETETGPSDPRAEILRENRRALEVQCDAKGRSFELIPIGEAQDCPVTDPKFSRSYVNFYIANGAIVMPAYGTASDEPARAAVSAAFPDRAIVQLKQRALPYGGGNIHCITQQQPAAQW
jgi:agmatine deiminase